MLLLLDPFDMGVMTSRNLQTFLLDMLSSFESSSGSFRLSIKYVRAMSRSHGTSTFKSNSGITADEEVWSTSFLHTFDSLAASSQIS